MNKMYELNTANDQFKNRSKSLFDNLEQLEVEHSNKRKQYEETFEEKEEKLTETDEYSTKCQMKKSYQNKGTIKTKTKQKFDPSKWTKYSLEDVDETNNVSNRKVAYDFLNQIKPKKRDEEMNESDENFKPKFNIKSSSQKSLKKHVTKKEDLKQETIRSTIDSENEEKLDDKQTMIIDDQSHIFKKTIKSKHKIFKRPENDENE